MKQIIFDTTKLKDQKISSETPSYFVFKGKNTKKQTLDVVSKCSCGCTKAIVPDKIEMGNFEIVLRIDKIGQSGDTNQSCALTFSNGQTEILYVQGIIK